MSKFVNIEQAIKDYQEFLLSNIMKNGRHCSEYYDVQLRIAQAACNYKGYIVTGTRHFCPIMRMQITAIGSKLLNEWAGSSPEQGLTDQYGRFLTRKEAYPIAEAAGQIIFDDCESGVLYSECYV